MSRKQNKTITAYGSLQWVCVLTAVSPYNVSVVLGSVSQSEAMRHGLCKPLPALDRHPPSRAWLSSDTFPAYSLLNIACNNHDSCWFIMFLHPLVICSFMHIYIMALAYSLSASQLHDNKWLIDSLIHIECYSLACPRWHLSHEICRWCCSRSACTSVVWSKSFTVCWLDEDILLYRLDRTVAGCTYA